VLVLAVVATLQIMAVTVTIMMMMMMMMNNKPFQPLHHSLLASAATPSTPLTPMSGVEDNDKEERKEFENMKEGMKSGNFDFSDFEELVARMRRPVRCDVTMVRR
jgi:hypothetical protein